MSERPRDYLFVGDLDVPAATGCASCGECCTHCPGGLLLSDLGENWEERARELLDTGRYTVDWWEGDLPECDGSKDRIYFMRPHIVGHEGEAMHPGWGGVCTFLTPTGCGLDREDRPSVCKALVPNPGPGNCSDGITKEQLVFSWREVSDRLGEIAESLYAA